MLPTFRRKSGKGIKLKSTLMELYFARKDTARNGVGIVVDKGFERQGCGGYRDWVIELWQLNWS